MDFDGAFDRVNRSQLFKKLILFGVGATYVSCLMAIYRRTDYIIFGKYDYASYEAMAGIKQGSPLSPMLFLFYVDDIFQFFISTFSSSCILETIHILMHADDTVVIASSRVLSILKIKHLLEYCRINSIKLETSKSHFIVINGNKEDRSPLPTSSGYILHCDHLSLLGSHLSASGAILNDLKLHYESRFMACIKFYNFLKANKLAPMAIKLKVLKSCVTSNILYNCETFGNNIPHELKKCYVSLIKSALGVRNSTPNDIILIECGLLPLEALVYGRQLVFYRKFKEMLKQTQLVTCFFINC